MRKIDLLILIPIGMVIGLAILFFGGIYLLEKTLEEKPCQYFVNTEFVNIPARCIKYYEK